MIDAVKHCVVPEVEIKTEISPEIIDEINKDVPAEAIYVNITNNTVKTADNDKYRSVFHSNHQISAKSKPPRTYAGKRSAPTTNYEYKWVTKEKCLTDGKTLCTTCGALIRNESMEQHKNKHLG